MSIDVTAVVNLHCEGNAATPSLISAWRAREAATAAGHVATLMIVLDRSDDATTTVAATWATRGAQLVSCDEGDLGAARNAAAAAAESDWLAFLDADDLWSENWLVGALDASSGVSPTEGPDVFHPEVNVIFGDHHSLLHHRPSDDPTFSWERFRLHNAWTALSFVRRRALIDLPFPRNRLDHGFGFEDWSWNMAVLDSGGHHHVVPDTCHFIRRTNNPSLLSDSGGALRTAYPVDNPAPRSPVTQLSELTAHDANLPPTHQYAPHNLSEAVLAQVGLAVTVEPTIAETLTGSGHPHQLAQNFNTHVTPTQRALESIELACSTSPPPESIAAVVDESTALQVLDAASRHHVLAEALRSPHVARLPLGLSPLIDATYRAHPQLRYQAPAQN